MIKLTLGGLIVLFAIDFIYQKFIYEDYKLSESISNVATAIGLFVILTVVAISLMNGVDILIEMVGN